MLSPSSSPSSSEVNVFYAKYGISPPNFRDLIPYGDSEDSSSLVLFPAVLSNRVDSSLKSTQIDVMVEFDGMVKSDALAVKVSVAQMIQIWILILRVSQIWPLMVLWTALKSGNFLKLLFTSPIKIV